MSRYFELTERHKNYLQKMGVDTNHLFERIGLSKTTNGKSVSINETQYFEIANSIDNVINDKAILRFGNVDDVTRFIPTLFAVMCAENGMSCFNRLSKYKKITGPYTLHVEQTDKYVNLRIQFDIKGVDIPRYLVLSEQVIIVGIVRKATGKHINPVKVTSIYDYGAGELAEYFGIDAKKASENLISFTISDMEEPFMTSNNIMWEYLQPELKRRVLELEKDNSLGAQVRTILFEFIPGGRGTIEEVSKKLAVSPRTLQRKLAAENTTFIKQLNHTRELMARNYLTLPEMTNEEIAFLIGYSDANAFSRAFKGWTGLTTSEYRKEHEK